MALGYIPLAVVRNTFTMFCESRSTRKCMRRHHELRTFLRYFRDNYIDGVFEPALWNVYTRDSDTRTNNHVEGFHHKWNKAIGRNHPSVWLFIRKLKDEQRLTSAPSQQSMEIRYPKSERSGATLTSESEL